jgi:hypothetical protein
MEKFNNAWFVTIDVQPAFHRLPVLHAYQIQFIILHQGCVSTLNFLKHSMDPRL